MLIGCVEEEPPAVVDDDDDCLGVIDDALPELLDVFLWSTIVLIVSRRLLSALIAV